MLLLALKMLIGNRASCLGVIFGIFLATLLISQQAAIFLGVVSRSYRIVSDVPKPDIWVMDPSTESEDKIRGMPDQYLSLVRSVAGVEWAEPIGFTNAPLATPSGKYEIALLYGISHADIIGSPSDMVVGTVEDLHREGGIIVDIYSANTTLATKGPNDTMVPLKIGDVLEINNRRAVVVGLCKPTRGFFPQPIIFASYGEFLKFNPAMNNRMGFIVAKARPGVDVKELSARISTHSDMLALTSEQFRDRIVTYFLKTGILLNFGLSVALGFIIGFSIAGQIFYIMTLDNLKYYALIKALGARQKVIFQMIILQAFVVGIIGFILGIGTTVLWGFVIKDTTLAFMFPWELLAFTGLVVFIICMFTAGLSIHKVHKADPQILMGN